MNPTRLSTFHVQTLGCKVNQYDSQVVREFLEGRGLVEQSDGAAADLTVINTCAVTSEAVRKSRALTRQAGRASPLGRVAVTGCAASESPTTLAALPGVALVAGPNEELLAGLARLLEEPSEPTLEVAAEPSSRAAPEVATLPLPLYDAARPDPLATPFTQSIRRFDQHTRAFLKVQDGCDCYCSFCVIPFLRGRVRSKPSDAVLAEAAGLLTAGHAELVLTGVHLGAFGRPHGRERSPRRYADSPATERSADESTLADSNTSASVDAWELNRANRLAELVADLLAMREPSLPARWRLRLSSLEATEVTERLVELLAQPTSTGWGGTLCRHLHLPLQSGSSRILRRMNRRYDAEAFVRTVQRLRRAAPDCAVSADVIVGFPGESESDFAETLAVAEACRFSHVHAFPYSVRPGTAAVGFAERVDPATQRSRVDRLTVLSRELADDFWRSLLGRTVTVIRERYGGARVGLTEHGAQADCDPSDWPSPPTGAVEDAVLVGYADGRFRAVPPAAR